MGKFMLNSFQMVDIETIGQTPGHSILVIGAVRFDPFTPWGSEGQAISATDRFEVRISRESNVKYGLKESASTLENFWDKQSDEARDIAFGGTVDLADALWMYRDWMFDTFGGNREKNADVNSYCHGATFDVPFIEWAYQHLGIPSPFPYDRTRDTRTVFELAGVSYKGTAHETIQDCYGQCAAICRSHDILGFDRRANRLPGWMLEMEGLAFPYLAA